MPCNTQQNNIKKDLIYHNTNLLNFSMIQYYNGLSFQLKIYKITINIKITIKNNKI